MKLYSHITKKQKLVPTNESKEIVKNVKNCGVLYQITLIAKSSDFVFQLCKTVLF